MKFLVSPLLDKLQRAMPRDIGGSRLICNNALLVHIGVKLPDGDVSPFDLLVEDRGGVVTVRERSIRRLPARCPERHINGDGTFCLGLLGVDAVTPNTGESARQWWHKLHGFLLLQCHATRIGEWSPVSWKHGLAVCFQFQLEQLAQSHPEIVELARTVFSTIPEGDQLAMCGDVRVPPLTSSERVVLENATSLLRSERDAEASYWREHASTLVCCKTMKNCPLNDGK